MKVGREILTGMQDPEDFNPLLFRPIDNKMRATEMNPHRRSEFATFTGHLGKLREQVEDRKQTISIALCLLDAPTGSPVKPDPRKIGFSGGPKHPAVTFLRAARAFGS